MNEVGRFSCDDCGKSYAWKESLAGKRVKCKCGVPLSVPNPALATVGEPVPAGFEDLYALANGTPIDDDPMTPPPLAGGPPCAGCGTRMSAGAVVCVACGYNAKSGKKLKTQRATAGGGGGAAVAIAGVGGGIGGGVGTVNYAGIAPRRRPEGQIIGDATWGAKDLFIPLALFVVGVILTGVEIWFNKGIQNFGYMMLALGVLTVINLVLVFAGVMTTVRLFDLGLGPIHTGLMKVAACAVLPGSIGGIVEVVIGEHGGGYAGWFISYLATLALFMWLLEMDYFEASICSTIIWVIRTWIGYALLYVLLGSILSGGGGGKGGGGGGPAGGAGMALLAAGGGSDAADEAEFEKEMAVEADKEAQELLKDGKVYDARQWFAGGENRRFFGRKRTPSIVFVESFYQAGATEVRVVNPAKIKQHELANTVIVTVPPEKGARKRVFAVIARLADEEGFSPDKDQGQKYLLLSGNGDDEEYDLE